MSCVSRPPVTRMPPSRSATAAKSRRAAGSAAACRHVAVAGFQRSATVPSRPKTRAPPSRRGTAAPTDHGSDAREPDGTHGRPGAGDIPLAEPDGTGVVVAAGCAEADGGTTPVGVGTTLAAADDAGTDPVDAEADSVGRDTALGDGATVAAPHAAATMLTTIPSAPSARRRLPSFIRTPPATGCRRSSRR